MENPELLDTHPKNVDIMEQFLVGYSITVVVKGKVIGIFQGSSLK
jgi:hypothetical protein